MVNRTLITTADERSWPKDKSQPILFLGEWCRRFSRKAVWQELNAEIAPYHWDDRKKLYNDYQYLQELYEKLLAELSNKLNQIHLVQHSPRYWRILIGPWLGYFIQMLFDRWYMLKQVIEQEEISKCCVINREIMSLIPNDMAHFNKLFIDDDWNEMIYRQLLELCWGDVINLKYIKKQSVENIDDVFFKPSLKVFLKKKIIRAFTIFNKFFSTKKNFFLYSSYLSLKIDLKLQVILGQFPIMWNSETVPILNADRLERQWKLNDLDIDKKSFSSIICQLIPLHIPTAYLEGYEQLNKMVDDLNWPENPKCIFTSNAYSADDVFKIWSAQKSECGTSLIIGQHGGHFGMNPFSFHEEHQIAIADKWLSWGWSDKTRLQITPVGNLLSLGSHIEYDPSGEALMVEMTMPRFSYHLYAAPQSSQWLDYLEEQQIFMKSLPSSLREQVLVRLYSNDYGWDQVERWKHDLPEVRIDSGHQDIRKFKRVCS